MRHRAIILLVFALLLGACDATNLPIAPTPAPTQNDPAPTSTPVALIASPTPPPVALATDTALPQDTPTAAPKPTLVAGVPSETPQPGGAASATPDPALEAELSQVEADTTTIRGLKPKTHVPEHFLTTSQLKAALVDQINEDYSPEKGKEDAMALWLLRLIDDPKLDLYQLQIDLLGEQVIGFYDNKKRELFVRADENTLSPMARETLSHEFTHALQDQYYSLDKIRPDDIESDAGTATLCLVEGDAVVTMSIYDRQYMSAQELQDLDAEKNANPSTALDKTPDYIKDSLFFPYEQGPFFIQALAQAQPGSYKGVNDALADPPKSSEQILHPEKYLDAPRDNPVDVSLPPLTSTLGAGWTYRDTDTLGEFDFQELLKVNGVNDNQAAAGWGGARYVFYQKGDGGIVAVKSVWDTAQDATEFDTALQQSLGSFKKSGNLWSDGTRYVALKSSGATVTFVSSTESAAVQKVLGEIK